MWYVLAEHSNKQTEKQLEAAASFSFRIVKYLCCIFVYVQNYCIYMLQVYEFDNDLHRSALRCDAYCKTEHHWCTVHLSFHELCN